MSDESSKTPETFTRQSSDNENSEKSNSSGIHIGKYITGQYELLKRILEYLPTDSLSTASCVCREWNQVSKLVIQTRAVPTCFYWTISDKKSKKVDVETQMINTLKSGYNGVPYIVLIFQSEMPLNLNELPANSLFGLLIPDSERRFPSFNTVESLSKKILCNDKIELVNIYSNGAIGLHQTIKIHQSSPNQRMSFKSIRGYFSGLFIPKMPGVKFSFIDTADINNSDLTNPKIDGPVKCLIILSLTSREGEIFNLVNSLQNRQKEPFAVAGGQVDRINYKNTEHPSFLGMLITGESVRAKTLFIPSSCRKKQTILSKLREFTPPKGKYIVAIQFTCIARTGTRWKQIAGHLDNVCFHTIYPNIPYTGCYVNGEICLQDDINESSSSRKKPRLVKALFHAYSTVILFLSFGPEE